MSHSTNTTNDTTSLSREPPPCNDARFRAGRNLIQCGNAGETAIQLFAILVEEARLKYGLDGIETSSCYYEYGNALFRSFARHSSVSETTMETNDGKDEKPTSTRKRKRIRSAAAEAAEKRLSMKQKIDPVNNSNETIPPSSESTTQSLVQKSLSIESVESKESKGESTASIDPRPMNPMNEDISLALEMMENAFSIMDQYLHGDKNQQEHNKNTQQMEATTNKQYKEWCQYQVPRVLCGIGDVFSFLKRHGDAADAFIRAIPYREQILHGFTNDETKNVSSESSTLTLDHLKARRLYVEAHVLSAEELLAHPPNTDVISTPVPLVTTDPKSSNEIHSTSAKSELKPILIVKASERIEFAKGYYEKAREELQETVYLMGKIAAKGLDLGTEKENVCFLATILMGVGNTIADIDAIDADNDLNSKTASQIIEKPKKR